jgi:predicted transcriptional regulator of viral defense system
MNAATSHATAIFRKKGGILRTHEAIEAGIHPRTLYAMRDTAAIEQTGRGLFRLAGLPPLSDPDLVVVAKRIPLSVICLISALAIHELTSQIPHAVQIALRPGARTPHIGYPPIEVFRFSPTALAAGVEERQIDGMTVRVFGPEKTLADVFKFRNRIGLEIAVESLRNYARRKRRRFDLILEFARACRVESVMRPYLEAVS